MLLTKFIVNLPDDEITDMNRIMYHTEQAMWYAHDHCGYPSLHLHQFCQDLYPSGGNTYQKACRKYREYKRRIPRSYLIILDKTQSFYVEVRSYFSGKWGLPGGKLDEGESQLQGAIREAHEETGLVIDPSNCKKVRDGLFTTVMDINTDTQLTPRTQFEISECRWAPV